MAAPLSNCPHSPISLVTGSTKTSSASKIPSYPPYHSRNSPPCYSTPVPSSSIGAMTTSRPSIPSCNTRLEYPYVVQSCSTVLGKRYVALLLVFRFSIDLLQCVLVKGWKASSGWGFPKGKINESEPQATCAIREVLLYIDFWRR